MNQTPDPVTSALPLSWVEFHILVALAPEPLHGYGIMQDTEARTGGSVTLEPGNLYRALQRMRKRGLVERTERGPGSEREDERRRYYRVTALGRRVAAAETRRMASLVQMATDRSLADPEGA